MTKELTEADLADYTVTFGDGRTLPVVVRAAYVTTEDRMPQWLLFKDHEHRVVAQFNANVVVSVTRAGEANVRIAETTDEDERLIRRAMAEAREHPGKTVTVSD